MTVGALLHARANNYIENGRDVHEWTILADPRRFDTEEVREFAQNKRHWNRPLRTESGIYVMVNRLWRKSLCYHLLPGDEHTVKGMDAVRYPPAIGAYGIEMAPAETIPFDVRTHFSNMEFLGKIAYERYRESRDSAVLVLQNSVLEGVLIDVPDKVVF